MGNNCCTNPNSFHAEMQQLMLSSSAKSVRLHINCSTHETYSKESIPNSMKSRLRMTNTLRTGENTRILTAAHLLFTPASLPERVTVLLTDHRIILLETNSLSLKYAVHLKDIDNLLYCLKENKVIVNINKSVKFENDVMLEGTNCNIIVYQIILWQLKKNCNVSTLLMIDDVMSMEQALNADREMLVMIKHTWFNKFFSFLRKDGQDLEQLSNKFYLNFCIVQEGNDNESLISSRDENSKFESLIKYDACDNFSYCIFLQQKEMIIIFELNYQKKVIINLEEDDKYELFERSNHSNKVLELKVDNKFLIFTTLSEDLQSIVTGNNATHYISNQSIDTSFHSLNVSQNNYYTHHKPNNHHSFIDNNYDTLNDSINDINIIDNANMKYELNGNKQDNNDMKRLTKELDEMIPNRKVKVKEALSMNDKQFQELLAKRRLEVDTQLENYHDVDQDNLEEEARK